MDYPGLPNIASVLTRRNLLRKAGLGAVAIASSPAFAETMIRLPFEGSSTSRHMTRAFPQKGPMILQRSRPPLLETPREVFDKGVFTPNDQFYVRWHWAGSQQKSTLIRSNSRCTDMSAGRCRFHCAISCTTFPASNSLRSTSVLEILAAYSSPAFLVRNGQMAPWATRFGRASH